MSNGLTSISAINTLLINSISLLLTEINNDENIVGNVLVK